MLEPLDVLLPESGELPPQSAELLLRRICDTIGFASQDVSLVVVEGQRLEDQADLDELLEAEIEQGKLAVGVLQSQLADPPSLIPHMIVSVVSAHLFRRGWVAESEVDTLALLELAAVYLGAGVTLGNLAVIERIGGDDSA